MTAPVLAYPCFQISFVLDTHGVGAVLTQEPKALEMAIASYKQSPELPERNDCTTPRELLVVVKTKDHFYHCLYGRVFRIRTDHASWKWLFRVRNPEGQVAGGWKHCRALISQSHSGLGACLEGLVEMLRASTELVLRVMGDLSGRNGRLLSPHNLQKCRCSWLICWTSGWCGWLQEWTPKQLKASQVEDVDISLGCDWKIIWQTQPPWKITSPLPPQQTMAKAACSQSLGYNNSHLLCNVL